MTTIQIERLRHSTIIHRVDDFDFGPFGSFAAVEDIEFDGYGYTVTCRMMDPTFGYITEREVQFVVDAGESVQYGGLGEPVLRDEADVSDEEWQAKSDAAPVTLEAATASFCDMLVARNAPGAARQAAE